MNQVCETTFITSVPGCTKTRHQVGDLREQERLLQQWGFERPELSRPSILLMPNSFDSQGYTCPKVNQNWFYLSDEVWIWERSLDPRNAA